jgi:hypothetical protein
MRDRCTGLFSRYKQLCLDDEESTPVAKFRKKTIAIIGDSHPASLEISPAGVDIIDHIIVTLIYIEKLRNDRENTKHPRH